MVKKLQKLADKQSAAGGTPSMAQLFDSQLASSVKDSAQQIWQAGLGAFAKAQGEGGKVFESLVKEGVSIQRRTQAAAEEKLGEVSNRMTKLSDDVQTRAGQQWDKLESIFEERVAKALGKLGDLRALAANGMTVRVAGRGRAVRDAIERGHPWLGAVVEPRHHGNFTLYASRDG